MASQDVIHHGTYFCRRSFFVVPIAREKELHNDKLKYNDQPDWKWAELKLDSVHTIMSALEEFHRLADEASRQFEWPTAYQEDFKGWQIRKHSWKHVSHSDINRRADDINNRRGKTLLRDTIFAEPPDYFRGLLKEAAGNDPKAVARLWHLCKSKEGLRRLLFNRYIWSGSDEEMQQLFKSIPTAGKLASRYVDCLVQDPDAPEGKMARENLRALTNPSSIRGSEPSGGRPKIPVSEPDILTINGMAYGWVGQIRYAEVLLTRARVDRAHTVEAIRDCLLVDLAPKEIKKYLKGKDEEGGGEERFKVARSLTATKLGISEGHVQKIFYLSKPPR